LGGCCHSYLAEDGSAQTQRSLDSIRTYLDPQRAPDQELLLTGKMGPMNGMSMTMPGMKIAAPEGEPISSEAKGIEWLDHMAAMNQASITTSSEWPAGVTHNLSGKFGAVVKQQLDSKLAYF